MRHDPIKPGSSEAVPLGCALFAPRSVALVGASSDPGKHASLPQRYLKKHGFTGRIYPINLYRNEIFGDTAYPAVSVVPDRVDHAFIMVRTESVVGAVKDCISAGVTCATILTGGFAETGEAGRSLQREIKEIAEGRIRLVGPNSLGVINTHASMALSANEVLEQQTLKRGRTGLISQSGSLIGALLSRGQARGVEFSTIVSVGNEMDLGVGEIGELMIDDPNTDVILLFLETIRDRTRFSRMTRRAYASGKPVIAYTLGRSAQGQDLASSHTGALVGSGIAVAAFLRDNGVAHVENFETLLEAPFLFTRSKPLPGKRVCVLTTTGGGAALVIDNLGMKGIEVVPPGEKAVGRLFAKGIRIENKPLVDLTLAGTNATTYGAVLSEFVDTGECDAIIAVVGSSSQSRPDRAVSPIIESAKTSKKPIAVFLTPHAEKSLEMLQDAEIAVFRTPESCADAVGALLRWQTPREAIIMKPVSIDPKNGLSLLSALGIPSPETRIVRGDGDAAVEAVAAVKLAFPVALKILSADIAHKTEVGGVVLGIASFAALRDAAALMLRTVRRHAPSARIDGFEIQTMETGLVEALVGYRYDAQVGPTITLGSGGVLAELLKDVVTRVAPVSVTEAKAMIEEVRGLRIVTGYRSLPKGDVDALAKAVSVLSSLATFDNSSIREAEINPLLIKRDGEGVVALDILLVSDPETQP